MAASEFFGRWAKTPVAPEPGLAGAGSAAPAAAAAAAGAATPTVAVEPHLLTSADTLALTTGSDFTPFMASGVDESVKRLALKKLFADPHFNIMDGLDIYIGDYNTFVPMSAAMVAALNHGKALLDPLSQLERPLMTLIQSEPVVLPNAAADVVVETGNVGEPGAAAAPATDAANTTNAPMADLVPMAPADSGATPCSDPATVPPAPCAGPADPDPDPSVSSPAVPTNAQPPASLQA